MDDAARLAKHATREHALREQMQQAIEAALVNHRNKLGNEFGELAAKKTEYDGSYMGKQHGVAERVTTDLGDLLNVAKEHRDARLALGMQVMEQRDTMLALEKQILEMQQQMGELYDVAERGFMVSFRLL